MKKFLFYLLSFVALHNASAFACITVAWREVKTENCSFRLHGHLLTEEDARSSVNKHAAQCAFSSVDVEEIARMFVDGGITDIEQYSVDKHGKLVEGERIESNWIATKVTRQGRWITFRKKYSPSFWTRMGSWFSISKPRCAG